MGWPCGGGLRWWWKGRGEVTKRSKLDFLSFLMVHQRGPIAPVIESLVLIWAASEQEEWRGQVVYLPL